VSYVGGYQGAPVSHLLDVMVQAKDYMNELGVHIEACTSEASAAAMLGASVSYPVRGAVTWKSIVGTNVASDALSYLASAGVIGGALIVLGEDYGEGGVVAQERKPRLRAEVHDVAARPAAESHDHHRHGRARVRALGGVKHAGDDGAARPRLPCARHLHRQKQPRTRRFDPQPHGGARRLPLRAPRAPAGDLPARKKKSEVRLPAARKFIADRKLNEHFDGDESSIGIVVQGGLYNNLVRALHLLGLANSFSDERGGCRIPILALNVVYPLVPEEITSFCSGKSAVLVIEEGQPEFIEQDIATTLRRADVQTKLHGKDLLPMAGDYSAEILVRALAGFLAQRAPHLDTSAGARWLEGVEASRARAAKALGALPARPPTFCVGCPERPVFSAMKLVAEDVGRPHVSVDVGCHAFATFEPFSQGNTLLGYGMSLASSAGVGPLSARRPVAVMGDGGFWHNGLLSGVASNLMNHGTPCW